MTLREWLERGEANCSPGRILIARDVMQRLCSFTLIGKNRAWLLAHRADDFAGCTAIRYAESS